MIRNNKIQYPRGAENSYLLCLAFWYFEIAGMVEQARVHLSEMHPTRALSIYNRIRFRKISNSELAG
jgi:hypothetical protein